MWNCRHELNSGVARIFPISAGIPGVPIWLLVISWCRFLNFLLTYRRRNGCNCLKHNYHYGMTRADFINRFKKHINIDGKNQVAHADAALVNVFINRYIVNSTLIMKCFNLNSHAKTLNMRRINTDLHRLCQIEFTISDLWGPFHQKEYTCRNFTTVVNMDLNQILSYTTVSLKGLFQD